MKKHFFKYILFVLLLLLEACGGNYSLPADHVRIHINANPASLNPMTASDAYESTINKYVFDSLIDQDLDTLEYIPALAERWEISEDKTTYTFYLRKDVTWHDGHPFTADDVVYSFNAVFMNPELEAPSLKSYYQDIKEVSKLDDYTVRFEYSRVYFRGLIMCGAFPVVPKHIVSQYEDFDASPYSRHPIGTGPYKFKRWTNNSSIVLERNEAYWGKKPDIRVIEFKVIADSAIALQILKKGELDVAALSSLQWARQTRTDKFREKFQVLQYPSTSFSFIGWNNDHPVFGDPVVRQAMTHLLNRKKINEKINFNLDTIVTGPFFPGGKQYNHNIEPLDFNIKKAKELLAQSGWTDSDGDGVLDKDGKKFEFTFLFPAGSKFGERVGTIYKEQLRRAGIVMNMSRMEWAAFLDKINKREFDATTLGWSSPFESDPYQIWDKSQAQEKNSSNFISFVNDEASQLIRSAKTEFDEAKRNQFYWKFQEIIHELQPYTFLYNSPSLVVVSRRFDNVLVHKAGLDLKEWKIKKN